MSQKKKTYLTFGACLAIGMTFGIIMHKLVMGIAIGCALGVYYERKNKQDKKDDI